MCPSEIVLYKTHPINNFDWCWGVYQPDCNWAELAHGRAGSYEQACKDAGYVRWIIEYRREHENDSNDL